MNELSEIYVVKVSNNKRLYSNIFSLLLLSNWAKPVTFNDP